MLQSVVRPAARILAVSRLAVVQPDPLGRVGETGIDKRPVRARVPVGRLGLEGDRQYDTKNHGGPEQAVYAYAREDLDFWGERLGRRLRDGEFGENLTVEGVDLREVVVGTRWQVSRPTVDTAHAAGPTPASADPRACADASAPADAPAAAGASAGASADASTVASTVAVRAGPATDAPLLLEVTHVRNPCMTFERWMAEPGWVRRFADEGRVGMYFRMLRPGDVGAGDVLTCVHQPSHGVPVAASLRGLTPEQAEALLASDAAGEFTLSVKLRAIAERSRGAVSAS